MGQSVKDRIIEQVDHLAEPQQRVLDYAQALGISRGRLGKDLLRFVGTIPKEDLKAMARAIHEGCENLDPDTR
jgi:hypothetical protein